MFLQYGQLLSQHFLALVKKETDINLLQQKCSETKIPLVDIIIIKESNMLESIFIKLIHFFCKTTFLEKGLTLILNFL